MAGRWLSGAVAALAALVFAPAATATEAESIPGETYFTLPASNGYKFGVIAIAPPEGDEGIVSVVLERSKHAFAFYSLPATVTDETIDADLGKLGRISVTRVATGRMKTVRGCEPGERERVEAERYEGTIEFRGEEEFAVVSAMSAPLEHSIVCTYVRSGPVRKARGLPGARLDVEARRFGKYRLEFDAVQRRRGAKTAVKVEVTEQHGEIGIQRVAWRWAGSGALRYDRRLSTATVRPPAPFSGQATYRRGARHQWSGNLTVDLPGRSHVPITGRGFDADLEHPGR